MDARTAHALIRFGLGRQGMAPPPADPLAWLAGQLDGPDPGLAVPAATTAEALGLVWQDHVNPVPQGQPNRGRVVWNTDSPTCLHAIVDAQAPFRERLVWFWANHFTVSLRHGHLVELAVAYVREAIRPHVTGRFVDMLQAVMHHPAMLIYLDNNESLGPTSPAGIAHHRGLNENLARECLELHTVSPASGYTQQDVTAFARLLTGWGVEGKDAPLGFHFYPLRHEPGTPTIMGQTFPPGQAGGEAALTWLGNHPMTFRHIATQLVRHFVADDPAPADVARIAAVLGRTRGDLKAATQEVLRLPQAWQPLTKLRSPADYAVAVLRTLDLPVTSRPDLGGAMNALGQPFFNPPLPNGWADAASTWGDGELLLRRADWAMQVTAHVPQLEPMDVAEASLGDLLSAETRRAVQLAPSRREALALLLASPEFMRR